MKHESSVEYIKAYEAIAVWCLLMKKVDDIYLTESLPVFPQYIANHPNTL